MSVSVLTWDGAVSAVSQDAVRDSRAARTASAIDDWDQEVDRGKVRARPGALDLPGQLEVAAAS